MVLGNVCSDSVDSESGRTKQLLLDLGGERPLLGCLYAADDDVVMLGCATLQNLLNEPAWAAVTIEGNVEPRLEQLLEHADAQMIRYASGALKNLVTTARTAQLQPVPQLSDTAWSKVQQREIDYFVQRFREMRAQRMLARAVQALRDRKVGGAG
eukprot:3860905-Prymnesium_polylepis.1